MSSQGGFFIYAVREYHEVKHAALREVLTSVLVSPHDNKAWLSYSLAPSLYKSREVSTILHHQSSIPMHIIITYRSEPKFSRLLENQYKHHSRKPASSDKLNMHPPFLAIALFPILNWAAVPPLPYQEVATDHGYLFMTFCTEDRTCRKLFLLNGGCYNDPQLDLPHLKAIRWDPQNSWNW